jgi:hypothetical protein
MAVARLARVAAQVVILGLVGFVLGLVGCFLATPVWWRLEPVLGIELAGHSGPADWLLIASGVLGGAFFIAVGFAVRRPPLGR